MAELGVYKGDFAKYMNKLFPDRKLYLFDTFEGFEETKLKSYVDSRWKTVMETSHVDLYKNDSIQLVLQKMKYPENCVIRKGFFPDTAEKIDDVFAMVSLDVDIYQTTKDGLEFFYPRMQKSGIIMIHDYNNSNCVGVKKAVDEFAVKENIGVVCLTDDCGSVVLVK